VLGVLQAPRSVEDGGNTYVEVIKTLYGHVALMGMEVEFEISIIGFNLNNLY
jgi:hypothetical protein